MTTLHFPAPRDWLLSSAILDAAAEAIDDKFQVSRSYHVPYLAGYNRKGTRIYIDSRMPEGYDAKKGEHKGEFVQTDRYLILHEAIEKILLMFFGQSADEHEAGIYQLCHQIALRLEMAAVEADGLDWAEYNAFMSEWVDAIGAEGDENLPPDLDQTPYRDEDDHAEEVAEAEEA